MHIALAWLGLQQRLAVIPCPGILLSFDGRVCHDVSPHLMVREFSTRTLMQNV
jgi:hypothetical protein